MKVNSARTDRTEAVATGQTLAERARLHGALADPARLAMVDHLVLGDASPGELGLLVDQPTNLLAHHLHVLDDTGIIRRVRSEGDRRRSYVQLRLDDPVIAALVAATALGRGRSADAAATTRVVFLCTHNSARSQLAAALWADVSDVPAASAGTHPATGVHPRAVAAGSRHGLNLTQARTSHLSDVLTGGDLIVAVCDNAYEELAATPTGPDLHWAVPDPVRIDTDEAFESTCEHLAPRIRRLAGALDRAGDPSSRSTP